MKSAPSVAPLILTLAIVATSASAQRSSDSMAGMNMGGSSMMPADSSNIKAGEMEAMSMDTEHDMDHDPHMAHMSNMALHMVFTDPRPVTPAYQARADKIVAELRRVLVKYQDYKVAEADGYKPFHPEIKQMKIVHFTKNWYGLKAAFIFNPAEPTSLLYERTSGGGYKLIGAMYTDRRNATQDQLNERVSLSIARWHQHVNFCFPPKGTDPRTVDRTKFGFNGSIATKAACDSAGGRFYPQIFGWMVHVYPWESNPELVWAH
jgi:hypothetical protein